MGKKNEKKELDKQTLDFVARILQNLPRGLGGVIMQDWQDYPIALRDFLSQLSTSPFTVKPDRSPEENLCPSWAKEFVHLDLATEGQDEFNLLRDRELWFHPEQSVGRFGGLSVYTHLDYTEMLSRCLNLADGSAILKKGVEFFNRFFEGKEIYLWKSVVKY